VHYFNCPYGTVFLLIGVKGSHRSIGGLFSAVPPGLRQRKRMSRGQSCNHLTLLFRVIREMTSPTVVARRERASDVAISLGSRCLPALRSPRPAGAGLAMTGASFRRLHLRLFKSLPFREPENAAPSRCHYRGCMSTGVPPALRGGHDCCVRSWGFASLHPRLHAFAPNGAEASSGGDGI